MKAADENGRERQWPVAVFLLGALLFSWPLLALFDVPASVAGVPLLCLYLFAAWAGLIVLIAAVSGRSQP
jgi:apolipoprotein N-acyltransferase